MICASLGGVGSEVERLFKAPNIAVADRNKENGFLVAHRLWLMLQTDLQRAGHSAGGAA